MRKYKEWLVNDSYKSFWDFGTHRGKITTYYYDNINKLSLVVDFFNSQNLTWHRIWELEWYNITEFPNIQQIYNYEKLICEDITQLIDGG
jgi:hypothetical protein